MGNNGAMTSEMIIQYSIVGVILLVAFGWIIWKMLHKSKSKDKGSCCGCSLSENCKKKELSHSTHNCIDK